MLVSQPPAKLVPNSGKIAIGLNEDGIALFGVLVLLVGAVLWGSSGPLTEKTDFTTQYTGGKIICCRTSAKLYDLAEQAALRKALYKNADPILFQHPPFEALFFALLARLPFRAAYVVWGLINTGIWLLLILVLRPYCPWPKGTLGYLAVWLLFVPLGDTLLQGQLSLVLLLVYAAAYMSLKRHRDFRAGAFMGMGLFKFQLVLPFALIFLFRRNWRFLAGFLATAVTLGAISLAAVGTAGILSYIRLLREIAAHPGNPIYGSAIQMATLHGFAYGVLGNWARWRALSFAVPGVSIVMVIMMAWWWVKTEREGCYDSFDLLFAASLGVSLITGVHVFTPNLSPLILALLLVAAHFPPPTRPALRGVLATSMVLFWAPPVILALVAWRRMYLMFPLLAIFTFATAWLAGTGLVPNRAMPEPLPVTTEVTKNHS